MGALSIARGSGPVPRWRVTLTLASSAGAWPSEDGAAAPPRRVTATVSVYGADSLRGAALRIGYTRTVYSPSDGTTAEQGIDARS